MSVMNGFRSELVDKIIGFNAHAVVKPYENSINSKYFQIKNYEQFLKLILSNSGEGVLLIKIIQRESC